MKLSRNITNKVNWVLDYVLPPFARDSRLIMYPLFAILFGKKAKLFLDFKDQAWKFNARQMSDYYKNLADVHIKRETDINTQCINNILDNLEGKKILDIACGRGYLAKLIQSKGTFDVVGIDFIVPKPLKNSINPRFEVGFVEKIEYPDKYFDTVICAHTLEHVQDLEVCIKELRRVCANKLIIVLPRQRPYRYTFDLHLHFFPYKFSVMQLFNNKKGTCIELGNDWLYIEKI